MSRWCGSLSGGWWLRTGSVRLVWDWEHSHSRLPWLVEGQQRQGLGHRSDPHSPFRHENYTYDAPESISRKRVFGSDSITEK